jgi:glycosyltransferase involved in cell wall biosynthesis
VHRLRLRRLPRWTLARQNARALSQRLRALAPDVAHAHSGGTYADGALQSGLPAVITVHGVIGAEARLARQAGLTWREDVAWRYEEWYERRCLRRAREVIAISPYVVAYYRDLTGARMHLVENPVADPYFSLPDASEPGVVLCAARIIQRKNIIGLLRAFARLHGDLPEARLRLAGEMSSEPDYVAQCQRFVAQNSLAGAVTFLGWLDEAALRKEYARSALLALVSWAETAPVAIGQAMACGRPVVASDVGGVRFMVQDGVTGLIVQPGDATGQAAALRRLLTDRALAATMGQRAAAAAQERFRADRVAAQTLAVYEQAIMTHAG